MPSEGGLKQYPKKDNKVTISQRISDHRDTAHLGSSTNSV